MVTLPLYLIPSSHLFLSTFFILSFSLVISSSSIFFLVHLVFCSLFNYLFFLSLSRSLPCLPFLSFFLVPSIFLSLFSLPHSSFLAKPFFISCLLPHFHYLSAALSLSLFRSSSIFLSFHHSLVITSCHSLSFYCAVCLSFLYLFLRNVNLIGKMNWTLLRICIFFKNSSTRMILQF